MFFAPYADANAIAIAALDVFLPPERLSVPAYACKNRWLDNAGGGHVGLWSNDLVPYTVLPSVRLDSIDHLTVAIVGPGQVAKTVAAENWLLRSVEADPANFLWYMQSDDGVQAYVKSRINPMIDSHEGMKSRLGTRPVDDSLSFKRFRGMVVEFLSAHPKTLINKSAPRIVADEIDNWMLLGDVKTMLDIRRQTFGRQSKLLAISHPDMAKGLKPATDWTSGIMSIYADSDRCVWYWPCPICGAVSSPAPVARRVMAIEYPSDPDVPLDVIEREAHLLCPVGGCKIGDHHRKAMNLEAFQRFGGWIGEGQEISEGGLVTGELVARDTAGFWIVGAMSPFVIGGIGGLARARVKAEREAEISGEDASIRQVIVKQWGIPYAKKRAAGSVDADTLAERADPNLDLGVVPEGVRFIVVFVDVQVYGFDYLFRGFGEHGESWVIDRGRISQDPETNKAVDPATSAADWDRLLKLFTRTFPLDDGSGRVMAVRSMGIDSRGQPGVTQQAYSAWKRWKKARATRKVGVISGRDVWTIILTGGASGINAPRLSVVYPDTTRKAGAAAQGQVPVASFNPNHFKDDLAGQLQKAEPGGWYIHFPKALRSAAPPHAFFEQVVAEHLVGARWEKKVSSARNEALDQLVGTHVVAHLHGLSRIDWEKPPNWAAPWDRNSHVHLPADLDDAPADVDQAEAKAGTDKKRSMASRLA